MMALENACHIIHIIHLTRDIGTNLQQEQVVLLPDLLLVI